MQRHISKTNLHTLTPTEVCALWLSEEGYLYLKRERDRLNIRLLDAPSGSDLAISLANEVSLIADVIDLYEQRKAALAEAA